MNNQIDMVQIFDDIEESENAFPLEEISFEDKVDKVKLNFFRLWDEGWNSLIGYSAGKDSSVLVSLFLNAAVEYQAQDGKEIPYFVVCTSNTMLENPIIDKYSRQELNKVEKFIENSNLKGYGSVDLTTPNLSNNYLVALIGGRTIATLPDNSAKCSIMLKVSPIQKQKRRVFKKLGTKKVCTMIGTRLDESRSRERAMKDRKESDIDPVVTSNDHKNPEYVLSPIMGFSLDDVFTFIGYVRSGLIPSYSNFDDLVEVYRDSNGGDCIVSAYSDGEPSRTGCGARQGCWICNRISEDFSLINMLKQEKYRFMKPLNDFRNALRAYHYDPTKRNWLARSVNDDNTVSIRPNAYSPAFSETLLKWALSIDADEWEATNGRPRFTLLRNEDLIAIDVLWNRYGYQQGLHACHLWLMVNRDGERFYPPENPNVYPSKPFPPEVRVPFVDEEYDSPLNGFRDLSMMTIGQERVVVSPSGQGFMQCETGPEFEVDKEGAELFFAWEIEDAVNRFHDFRISPTAAYQYLIRLGVVVLSKGSQSEQDRMLRMANTIWRTGIRDYLNDPAKLVEILGFSEEVLGFQGNFFDAA